MKILILTQVVDSSDPVLGYFHTWLLEFSKRCEKVTVICLKKGNYNLPENVHVYSLGKEGGQSRLKYIFNFYQYILKFRHDYDSVLVHMNPEYIVLCGWLWKLWRKKIALWYVHRQVNLKLRMAEQFVDKVFTVAEESFRLSSRKVQYVGHGVDIKKFSCAHRPPNDVFQIISVGRITKIKNLDTLIASAKILKDHLLRQSADGGRKFRISIIGGTVTEDDDKYFDGLKKKILKDNLGDVVWFKGSVSFENIKEVYCESDLSINLTPTGGIDKAVLESMSCGVPALVSNEAFKPIFGFYAEKLIFKFRDAEDVAQKVLFFMEHPDLKLREFLKNEVYENRSIEKLVRAIIGALTG